MLPVARKASVLQTGMSGMNALVRFAVNIHLQGFCVKKCMHVEFHMISLHEHVLQGTHVIPGID